MARTTNQKGAKAKGDIVGGDKITHYNVPPAPVGKIDDLLKKLQAEVDQNAKVAETIDSLKRFLNRRSHDGIEGLEAKLSKGGRGHEYLDAIEKKELFAKLLEKWSLYASAQEIFAHLLARAEYEFTYFVRPQLQALDEVGINKMVDEKIIQPTMKECEVGIFAVDHSVAMGMIYWLAEQCYVRWHQ